MSLSLQFCALCPKVELHAHLSGCIRRSTLEEMKMMTENEERSGGSGADWEQGARREKETLLLLLLLILLLLSLF